MGALERFTLTVVGVLAIVGSLFLAVIVLILYGATELFLRMFPGLRGKLDAPDHVPGGKDE